MLEVLIGSHISTIRRLYLFKQLVKSIRDQTIYPTKIKISMSYDINIDILKKYTKDDELFKFYLHKHRKTQFEHYLFLSKKIDKNTNWILFSDDDDLWHKNRIKAYHMTILKYEKIDNLICISSHNICHNTTKLKIDNTDDVDKYLKEGIIKNVNYCEEEKESHMTNYVNLCVRKDIFVEFFKFSKDELLKNDLCDCRFYFFIKSYDNLKKNNKNTLMFLFNDYNWMYFWRNDFTDSICNKPCDKVLDAVFRNMDLCLSLGGDKKKVFTILKRHIKGISNNMANYYIKKYYEKRKKIFVFNPLSPTD